MMKTVSLLYAAGFFLATITAREDSREIAEDQLSEIDMKARFSEDVIPQTIVKVDFESCPAGQLPEGWSEYFTGSGDTEWKVVKDNGNNVMAQLRGVNPNNHFNIVICDTIDATNMILTARLRGVTGEHDQGGGFVWRFVDKRNYYVVRANPLENNVVPYKVEDGKRTDLPLVGKGRTYGMDVPSMGNRWHTLKIIVKNDLFTVFLDERELFAVQDQTFSNAGKVGFWTKADAVTYFDDFEIRKY